MTFDSSGTSQGFFIQGIIMVNAGASQIAVSWECAAPLHRGGDKPSRRIGGPKRF